MKKYEYVSVSYKLKDLVFNTVSNHREIIDEYAANGFRYVDAIITEVDNGDRIRKIDLVFEKDEEPCSR